MKFVDFFESEVFTYFLANQFFFRVKVKRCEIVIGCYKKYPKLKFFVWLRVLDLERYFWWFLMGVNFQVLELKHEK